MKNAARTIRTRQQVLYTRSVSHSGAGLQPPGSLVSSVVAHALREPQPPPRWRGHRRHSVNSLPDIPLRRAGMEGASACRGVSRLPIGQLRPLSDLCQPRGTELPGLALPRFLIREITRERKRSVVYGPAESQRVVFEHVCPLLTSLLDGYNVCIMAYGQTGSGKSYTMLGPRYKKEPVLPLESHSDLGIIPRAVKELFRLISENPSRSPKVEVSIVEVYNNDIFDLLAKDSCAVTSGVKREVLTTKEGKKEVPSLTYESVRSAEEFMTLVGGHLQLRAKHATLVHADSSRSHLIITVTLTTAPSWDGPADQQSDRSLLKELDCPLPQQPATGRRWSAAPRASSRSPGATPESPAGHVEQVRAKLQLVDLAGSECAGVSGVTGVALRETSSINRSLAALADVLGALSERRGHVPYRNSKLTHLLQDALGGDAKLLVILCVSPCQKHVAETLQSLGFGARARQVQRGWLEEAVRPPESPGCRLGDLGGPLPGAAQLGMWVPPAQGTDGQPRKPATPPLTLVLTVHHHEQNSEDDDVPGTGLCRDIECLELTANYRSVRVDEDDSSGPPWSLWKEHRPTWGQEAGKVQHKPRLPPGDTDASLLAPAPSTR
ncbi:PREDICTED: kinesin-like protein KIF25 [Ceratotherium simum simum]|uniref:Kinesin-like protein n=1 Tax=Ceratotherium simum simum TaxID=73337 RepID=A0ABM1DGB9_CERSS|nr:PREDICTED: kinesin-like protein KIF25 [Ceratotherium simum simum]